MSRHRKRANLKPEMVSFYTFAREISVEEAMGFKSNTRSQRELMERARINRECENECGNPVWRYGVGELCFVCCTGETDASDDYELAWVT